LSNTDSQLLTVDIERRGYGRRYTWLPVDDLRRDGFAIDFAGAYTRPEQIDIRRGDIARWRENGRLLQGDVTEVRVDGQMLHVRVDDTRLLPADAYYP
jgi:hypothetical protein